MNSKKESISSQFSQAYGSPGEAPRVLGLFRVLWPLLFVMLATGYLLRAWLPTPALTSTQVGLLFFLLSLVSYALLLWGNRRLNNFFKGAKGEEWVAHELAFLPASYTIFNGLILPGGKQNFDHIVIGPSGIFVVETKNWKGSIEFHQGKLFAGGHERPPIKQVKAATTELIEFLNEPLPIYSVLCFIKTKLPEEIMNVNEIIICSGASLLGVLQDSVAEPLSESTQAQVVQKLKQLLESE